MRIEIADQTGVPVPQFVVHAENACDRQILKMFCALGSDKRWVFWRHGQTYKGGEDGVSSFNFGYIAAKHFKKTANKKAAQRR